MSVRSCFFSIISLDIAQERVTLSLLFHRNNWLFQKLFLHFIWENSLTQYDKNEIII